MHSYIDMMKITLKKSVLFSLLALTTILASCKDDRPSVAKIYVRSESNELLSDAMVVLIAKTIDNEAKIEYVDTLMTNASGFAQFNLEEYYKQAGKNIAVANFDLVCKKSDKQGFGKIRTRIHTIAVETVKLNQ